MPFVTVANVRHYYRLDGRDDRPVVMLSHSLGQDHSMWDPQAADLGNHFRVLRYDIRGHGASDITPGDYTVELRGAMHWALPHALGIEQFAFCGLSLGGMIGQWLALNAPEKISALVLANTSPRPDAQGMETRRQDGSRVREWPPWKRPSWGGSFRRGCWRKILRSLQARAACSAQRIQSVTREHAPRCAIPR